MLKKIIKELQECNNLSFIFSVLIVDVGMLSTLSRRRRRRREPHVKVGFNLEEEDLIMKIDKLIVKARCETEVVVLV